MASNVTLSQHLSRAEASAQECADAWAAWQESARNAGFAADGTTDLSDTHVHAEMKINGINEDVKKY